MKVIVDGKRYDLSKWKDLELERREHHGISLRGVYLHPDGKRVLVNTYSIWDDGTGKCVGAKWHFASAEEIAVLAEEFDSEELVALVPEGD